MPATPSAKVAILGCLLLAAAIIIALWFSRPTTIANGNKGQSVPHEEVTRWRAELAKGPSRVVIRHASEDQQARSGEPHKNILDVESLGPLPPEVEAMIRRQLETGRDSIRRALLEPHPSGPVDETRRVLAEATAFMELCRYEVCLQMLQDREYVTLRSGSPLPPLPSGVDFLQSGSWPMGGLSADAYFIIAPGGDVELDNRIEHVEKLWELVLETRAGEFNNLEYGERVKKIEAHFAAESALAQGQQGSDGATLEQHIIDSRLSIDRQRYTLHLRRRP